MLNSKSLQFDILKQNDLMRVGIIHTPHGNIKTPTFIGAATRATIKALTMNNAAQIGAQAILSNTYHLMLTPGIDLIASAGGLAEFTGWSKPTFTDSGGFQIFSLPDVKITENGANFKSHLNGDQLEMTPEISMQAQWVIGADIHMAFDQLAKSDTREVMENAMDRTHRWLLRSIEEHKKNQRRAEKNDKNFQYLYAVVQGGDFLDLRKKSAQFSAEQDVDGFGIGGVFKVTYLKEILTTVNNVLPNHKPRHLLGMGQEPIDIFVGVEYGCDTFDCVAPTRMARNGSLYTVDGRINIKNAKFKSDFSPVDSKCDCECCQQYTKAYLHHLFKTDEITAKVLASIHNERFVIRLTEEIRQAILEERFFEYKDAFLKRYMNN